MKINKDEYNWYGFDHKMVQKKFEGDLTYVGTFCVQNQYNPVAVYHNTNPDRKKNHKDYMLLWLDYNPITEDSRLLVSGLDADEMEKERYQSGIICPDCAQMLYSVNRHDFRHCTCKKCAIDGGKDYMHITGDPQIVEIDLFTGEIVETPKNEEVPE